MPTISEQLAQLQQDREDLVDNLETMGISGLSGDETFTELVPEVLNISGGGGADLSDYFTSTLPGGTPQNPGYSKMIKNLPSTTTVASTNLQYAFSNYAGTTIPLIDTSNITDMSYMFYNAQNLQSIPQIDTSNVTNMSNMFTSARIVNMPVLNTSKVTNFQNMFGSYGYFVMNDTSVDNVLQMCINATSYNGTKTLKHLGFEGTYMPSSRIQALPHYQDFINAGWTIGY